VSDFNPVDINPEPIDPRVIDAASGSVFTGERTGLNRWTPKRGGKFSVPDIILLGSLALVVLVILALIIL
jgi:hypothetical protein